MEIGIDLLGERKVDLRFEEFPETARVNLRKAIEDKTGELADLIRNRVPKRTGKLASLIQSRVSESTTQITGVVAVAADFGKAGALEYGTHKTIVMKSSHVFDRIVPTFNVERKLNIEARSFLRGPLDEIASGAFDAMRTAVESALDE